MNIDQFKQALSGGGARNNQFRVTGPFPSGLIGQITGIIGSAVGGPVGQAIGTIGAVVGNLAGTNSARNLEFLCNAASIPAVSTGVIPMRFRGKTLPIAGDRVFQPWTIGIINDTNFNLRTEFEKWSQIMTTNKSNIGANNLQYMMDWKVEQLDRSGGVLATYNFVGCWPEVVGDIQLSMNNQDQIEEFPVILQYMYWERTGVTQ